MAGFWIDHRRTKNSFCLQRFLLETGLFVRLSVRQSFVSPLLDHGAYASRIFYQVIKLSLDQIWCKLDLAIYSISINQQKGD